MKLYCPRRLLAGPPHRRPRSRPVVARRPGLAAYPGRVAARPAAQETLKAKGLLS